MRGPTPRIHPLTTEDFMQRIFPALGLALGLALFPLVALAAINTNTATKDELVALPGIGPAKAQAILDYRSAHGPFKSVEELKDVKGIGAKRFERLKSELTVAGTSTKPAPRPAEKSGGSSQRSAKGEVTMATKQDVQGAAKP